MMPSDTFERVLARETAAGNLRAVEVAAQTEAIDDALMAHVFYGTPIVIWSIKHG
jgi:hypothetical protein